MHFVNHDFRILSHKREMASQPWPAIRPKKSLEIYIVPSSAEGPYIEGTAMSFKRR